MFVKTSTIREPINLPKSICVHQIGCFWKDPSQIDSCLVNHPLNIPRPAIRPYETLISKGGTLGWLISHNDYGSVLFQNWMMLRMRPNRTIIQVTHSTCLSKICLDSRAKMNFRAHKPSNKLVVCKFLVECSSSFYYHHVFHHHHHHHHDHHHHHHHHHHLAFYHHHLAFHCRPRQWAFASALGTNLEVPQGKRIPCSLEIQGARLVQDGPISALNGVVGPP